MQINRMSATLTDAFDERNHDTGDPTGDTLVVFDFLYTYSDRSNPYTFWSFVSGQLSVRGRVEFYIRYLRTTRRHPAFDLIAAVCACAAAFMHARAVEHDTESYAVCA